MPGRGFVDPGLVCRGGFWSLSETIHMSYFDVSLGENEVEVARLSVPSFVIPKVVTDQETTEIILTNRRLVASAPERYGKTVRGRIAISIAQIVGVRLMSGLQGLRILRLIFWLAVLAWVVSRFATLGPSTVWDYAVSTMGRLVLFAALALFVVFVVVDVWQLYRNARQTQIVISTTGGVTYRLPASRYETAKVGRFLDTVSDAATDAAGNS